jgi:uncharacterized protein
MDKSVADIIIKIANQKLSNAALDNLVSFKVNASIGVTSIAKLNFFDNAAELQGNASFAIGKSIQISIGAEQQATIVFEGDITRIDYMFNGGEADKIQLICYDGLHRLSKIWHSRAFVSKKISDIATTMAGEASLTGNSITATTVTYDHLYQNNQSNLDFLRMHAKRIGYEVDIDGKGLVFKTARYTSPSSSSVVLEWGEDLIEFTARIDSSDVLSKVVVSSWDPDKKENVEATAAGGSETNVGSVTTLGTSTISSKLKSEAKVYRLDLPNLTSAEATKIAKSHLTMASLNYLKAEGICKGEPKFALGKTLQVKGVGDKISGTYYIYGYEHLYSKKGFKTSFEIQTNGTFT